VCALQPKDPDSPVFIPALVSLPDAGGTRLYVNIVGCKPGELRLGMPLKYRADLSSGALTGASLVFSPVAAQS
jgi:hypothetical protein